MRTRHILGCFLLMFFMAHSQAAPTATTRPASATTKPTPGYLDVLTTDDRTVFVLHDPLPHLTAILENKQLEKALSKGALAKLLQSGPTRIDVDFAKWREGLVANDSYVPQEIAIATTDKAWSDIDHVCRTMTLFVLCKSAINVGGKAVTEELPKAQAELLAELKTVKMPQLRVWVKLRSEEDAQLVMLMAKRYTAQMLDPEANNTADRLQFKFTGSQIAPPEIWPDALQRLGVITDAESDIAKKLGAAISGLSFGATLERIGSGLKLTLSDASDKAKPLASAPGVLGKAQAKDLFVATWQLKEAKKAMTSLEKWWAGWSKTEAGKHLRQIDTQDSLSGVLRLGTVMNQRGDSGYAKCWVENGLRGMVQERDVAPAKPLRDQAWARMVPADSESVIMNSEVNLGAQLQAALDQIEGRAALQSLRASLRGQAAEFESFLDKYYESFAEFRELVHSSVGTLGESEAILISTQGKLKTVDISYVWNDEKMTLSFKDMPMVETATLTSVAAPEAAGKQIEALYRSFLKGLYSATSAPAPARMPAVVKKDLGLGVPTFVFEGGWLPQVTGSLQFTMNVTGDFDPHYFLLDKVLVLSSSTRLSKQIIETQKNGKSLQLPASKDPMIAYGHVPTRTVVGYVEIIGKWIEAVGGKIDDSGVAAHKISEVMEAFAEVASLIDHIDWSTTQANTVRTSQWEIQTRAVPVAPAK